MFTRRRDVTHNTGLANRHPVAPLQHAASALGGCGLQNSILAQFTHHKDSSVIEIKFTGDETYCLVEELPRIKNSRETARHLVPHAEACGLALQESYVFF